MDRSFFITPTRLSKNPFLWRTIKMMVTVKPHQVIHMPESTVRWLRSNWALISTENVVMCVERSSYGLEFDWKANTTQAEKVMDLLIKGDKKEIALGNPYLREEVLTTFIENDLKNALEKGRGNYGGTSILSTVLRNINLKTYQLEKAYAVSCEAGLRKEFYELVVDFHSWNIVPDYIVQEILNYIVKEPLSSYSYSYSGREGEFFREGLRRGLLSQSTPTKVTVASQPRPTSFVIPAAPVVAVAEVK